MQVLSSQVFHLYNYVWIAFVVLVIWLAPFSPLACQCGAAPGRPGRLFSFLVQKEQQIRCPTAEQVLLKILDPYFVIEGFGIALAVYVYVP